MLLGVTVPGDTYTFTMRNRACMPHQWKHTKIGTNLRPLVHLGLMIQIAINRG